MLAAIRQAQELSVFMPIRHAVPVPDGRLVERFSMTPYTTLLYWITPFRPDVPAAPAWIRADPDGSNMVIRWEPGTEPSFYTYELFRADGDMPGTRLSPLPLRAALWVDTAPPPGPHRYSVRTISASGVASGVTAT
jgi:hypothetical protein